MHLQPIPALAPGMHMSNVHETCYKASFGIGRKLQAGHNSDQGR